MFSRVPLLGIASYYGDAFIIPPPTVLTDILFSFLFETSACRLRDGDEAMDEGIEN